MKFYVRQSVIDRMNTNFPKSQLTSLKWWPYLKLCHNLAVTYKLIQQFLTIALTALMFHIIFYMHNTDKFLFDFNASLW